MGEKEDRETEYELLEARGEVEVRHLLNERRMVGGRAIRANSWLREKEEGRREEGERKTEDSRTEQLAIAKAASTAAERAVAASERAAEAAERDAEEVRKANIRANVALAIAAISAIVAIISLFLKS